MKKLLCLMGFLGMAACSHVQPVAPNVVLVDPAKPRPVAMLPVKFNVVNSDQTYICLTPQNYENISINLKELERYLRELQENRNFYKNHAK